MSYIRGEAREQTTMFPVTLEELIPADHVCRVIEAFVGRLAMAESTSTRTPKSAHPWMRSVSNAASRVSESPSRRDRNCFHPDASQYGQSQTMSCFSENPSILYFLPV
jgi:hypothetical protein